MNYTVILKFGVTVCFLFSTLACHQLDFGGRGRNPLNPNNDHPAVSPELITVTSDPREVIINAYQKLSLERSYRYRHIMTGAKGTILTGKAEFVAPDSIHGVQQETGMETIIIGGKFYIKIGSTWEQSDLFSTDNPRTITNFGDYYLELSKNMKELKLIGPNTIEGTPVMVYQYTHTTGQDSMQYRVWIGVSDNALYKMEFSTNLEDEKKTNLKNEYYFYDFGADIKIEPPIR